MNTWIFQCNPQKFLIENYFNFPVVKNKIICWKVNQQKKKIKSGDTVYIWRAKGKSLDKDSVGIIAKAEIICDPKMMPDDQPQLWVNKEKGDEIALRVNIRLEEVRLKLNLKKENLKQYDIFKNALIITTPNQTNFPLTDKQVDFLDLKWKENNRGE